MGRSVPLQSAVPDRFDKPSRANAQYRAEPDQGLEGFGGRIAAHLFEKGTPSVPSLDVILDATHRRDGQDS